MGSDAKMQLKVLRDILGERRYRVARLRYRCKLELPEIARRLGVCRTTITDDLKAIQKLKKDFQGRVERERLMRSRHFDERIAAYAMN